MRIKLNVKKIFFSFKRDKWVVKVEEIFLGWFECVWGRFG